MASTMAAAAAHSMPPFPLPAVPRVRPPPIPKGTPGPNTLPQPGRPPRNGLVWVDGRWAYPQSRSGQHKQEIVSKQLEKALQHEVHGMNIYAYKHMRTHQVVYSLTKNMDNNKILKQLLYHGKKTVPGALRRDVWRPYFSVHFSKTPAGALKGLRVFQELRELSALRQLSPPEEMTRATQQEVDNIKRGYEAVELRDKTTKKIPRTKLLVLPVAGKKLPKKWLARRLMNQAATSVADIAAVLTRQTNPVEYRLTGVTGNTKDVKAEGLTPQQQMARIAEARKTKEEELSIRNYSRLQEIRKKEEAKADQLEQRQGYLAPKPGMVKVDAHTKDRVSMEYDGIGQHLAMIEEADELTSQEIGAAQRLEYTLGNIESEKKRQRQQIEKSMGKEIKDRLMKMTQAERDQIEKDVEAERAEKQTEIDSKVAATREKYRQQRVELYKQPATGARTRALRKLSRDSQAEVFALKTDLRTRHLKWAGPFAKIATAVDEAMLKIDEEWEEALIQLRQEVNQQQENHAEPGNHEVEIRWANLRDGTHARSWPDTVFHTELQPKAVSKSMIRAATTQFHIDADEERIETQVGLAEASRRSTVHVFGSLAPDPAINTQAKGRYETPAQLLARQREERYRRIDEWRDTEVVLLREKIITMRSRRDELARVFARTEVDQEYTPYIYNAVLMIEGAAEKANDKLKGDAYKIDEVEDIIGDIEYVRQEYLPGCQGDLEYSANPIADEARIQWTTLMTDLLVLEVRNPEARKQADIRNRFFGLFNEREILEDSIERFRDDPKLFSKAQREKDEFDLNNPFIITILARREAALENVPAEIEDAKAEISRLEEEIKTASADSEDVRDLQAQLSTEQADLHTKEVELAKVQREEAGGRDVIRESIRQDKQAWLDYKQEQGGVSYGGRSDYFESSRSGAPGGVPSAEGEGRSHSGAVKDARGMVMENPADAAEEGKKKGFFARLFGRGK